MSRLARPFGCLTGCLTWLVLFLVAGMVFVAAVDAVFAPWSFYLGGRFHPVPGWQGIGTLHASSGDYVLYVWMYPVPGGRMFNLPSFSGSGSLCTPRGERYTLLLSAGMNEHTGLDTNGKAFNISMYHRRWNDAWKRERRPRLTLRGHWQNPDLVMDDEGSLSRAFLPDGTVYLGPARNQPAARETVPIVLHQTAWSGWLQDCRR